MNMNSYAEIDAPRYKALTSKDLPGIAAQYHLSQELLAAAQLFSTVLPFRVNRHILDGLIDWNSVPDDPVFRLVFPLPGMITAKDEAELRIAQTSGDLPRTVKEIQNRLNPHPGGQTSLNVPAVNDAPLEGVQHKYRETVLYFPSKGQTCHAYCTYCFRWPQFVGNRELKFRSSTATKLVDYLMVHPEVHDVLITGGDPAMMRTDALSELIEQLETVPTVRAIRLGTKALTYWPYRFTTDSDADELLRVIERVVNSGRTFALMAHVTTAAELRPAVAENAVRRLRNAGATLYGQSPVLRGINDSASDLASLWLREAAMGIVPYYQFVARDTGPQRFFSVPLHRATAIFRDAYCQMPGLQRLVRGPVMSCTAGKLIVDGVMASWTGPGSQFVVRFIQARNATIVNRPFFAYGDRTTDWVSGLTVEPNTPEDLLEAMVISGSRVQDHEHSAIVAESDADDVSHE